MGEWVFSFCFLYLDRVLRGSSFGFALRIRARIMPVFSVSYFIIRVSVNKLFLDPSFGIQYPTTLPPCDINSKRRPEGCRAKEIENNKKALQVTTTRNVNAVRSRIEKGKTPRSSLKSSSRGNEAIIQPGCSIDQLY